MDNILSHLAEIVLALIVVAELVVRITPTKEDDGFIERIGGVIRKFLDMLGLPNKKVQ